VGARKKKVIRAEWPRVYWTPKDGRLVLCVDSRKTGFAAGGRRFWHSEAEALAYAEQIVRTRDNEGAAGFAELSMTERRDALEALAHLNRAGTLLDAAILFMRERERRERLAAIPTGDEAINAYLSAKRAEEQRGEISRLTLYEIESKMRIVREAFGAVKVTEIDEAAVSAFIRKLPHAARGKANIRTKLSQFLNYCRREGKWITANPTESIKVRVKNGDVKILAIPEVRQLLKAAQACELPVSVVPYLAVQLFAGLRPFEAARLRWERIHFDSGQIEVLGETSKTRETRFAEMEPLLSEWLLPFRLPDGPITGPFFAETLRAVKAAAGFTFGEDDSRPWPKDVLRHCFGSYWLAVHKDRAHLAELMGTSLQMIKTHYKRAIPQSVAEGFWKLAPSCPGEPGKIISISAAAWSRPDQSEVPAEEGPSEEGSGHDQVPMSRMEKFPTLVFRFAKTMPEIPHEYVVRGPENETEYVQLFHTIEQQGVWEMFHGRKYQYWYSDGWKYWRMDKLLSKSQVINRARVECAA
jgi:site-specific recombinase XerC